MSHKRAQAMRFKRTAMEQEAPEHGDSAIRYNLAESGITSRVLKNLRLTFDDLALVYGNHIGKPELRELTASDADSLRPDAVLTTVGAASALFMVAISILKPGDRIVVAFPNYITNFDTPRTMGCEIAYQVLAEKEKHLTEIRQHIRANFETMREWMAEQRALEWVEPGGGVVCFQRIRAEVEVDIDRFYHTLNHQYETAVGPGHWFEMDRRFMRVGFGFTDRETLKGGLESIIRAVEDAS